MLCSEYFDKVRFKEVIPINNEAIVKKIHTSYRVNYLRETIFAKEEGPVVQGLAFVSFNCAIEILTALLNNVKYLQNVMAAVREGSDIEKQNDALQFLMDMCCSFKQYQQFFSNALNARANSISVVMLKHLHLLQHVKDFFRLDTRVIDECTRVIGFDLIEEQPNKTTDEREVTASDAEQRVQLQAQLKKFHNRFDDKILFDVMLTQFVEMINIILQTSTKDLIMEFLKDEELAVVLGQHVFFSPEETLRGQIVELFKQMLDMSGNENLQIKLEKIII